MILLILPLIQNQPSQLQEPNRIKCEICINVITDVYIAIQDPSNMQQIENFLKCFCQSLPFDIFHWCESFIGTFFEQLVYNIMKGHMPNQVCKDLGVCVK
ncbi:Saposin-like_type B domin-containing protein [Hexamita inflata]|uniref:Saposin-like_type B domin-containing protein n=1 Tax=Hexamita inflata TaxID=28002 RepID=A0ABP1H9W2_9EUKA